MESEGAPATNSGSSAKRRLLKRYVFAMSETLRIPLLLTLLWLDLLSAFAGLFVGEQLWGSVLTATAAGLIGVALSQIHFCTVAILVYQVRVERINRITGGVMDGHQTPEQKYESAMDLIVKTAKKKAKKT